MTNNLYSKSLLTILLIFIIGFQANSSSAQRVSGEKISGTVKTIDGKPAAYITVLLKDTFLGAITDTEGKFVFTAPAGNYTMIVSSISTHKQELPLTVRRGVENIVSPISIMEDIKTLEQVVVTGQFSAQSLRNSVYKVRVIGSDQIKRKGAQDVQSLLNTEIGIRLSNDMALGETDFELMGMSGNNVKVLIDGVPVIDRDVKKQSLSQIDISSIERVEIVEGPMSVVYGTDALAGVINIITKKPTGSVAKDAWSVSGGLHEESVGNKYAFLDGHGLHRENIQLGWTGKIGLYATGGLTRNSSGGWQGDRTGREMIWQPKDQYMYNATLGYAKGDLKAWYRLDYLDEEIHTPLNATQSATQQISDRKYLTDRYTHQLHGDWKINNRIAVNMTASYQDYERRTQTTITDTDTGEKWLSLANAAQDTTTMSSAFARGTATWKVSSKITLQPGIEYQWQQGAGNRLDGERNISDLAAYLSAEWRPVEWLNIRPGVRTIVNSDYKSPWAIPTLLSKFSINHDMDLRVSYARGFRSPTLRELYFSFHNDNHSISGNTDLKAEYSNNFSAAFTWRILHDDKIRLTSTLSGFYNDFRDRIELIEVDAATRKYTYDNLSRYKTVGGTLENALAWGNLNAQLGISLVGRYNNLSEDPQYSSENMSDFRFSPEVSSSISYQIEKTGTNISLFYKFTGTREEYYASNDEISLRGMKSYHWADLTVTQRLWKQINLNVGVKNLFNVTMIDNTLGGGMGSTSTASLVGSGRSFFIGINFNFSTL